METIQQPYLENDWDKHYNPTTWLDDVPEIGQTGTPMDQEHFNNLETGIDANTKLLAYLTTIMTGHEASINDVKGETHVVTLKNTGGFYQNNSDTTIVLTNKRDTMDYIVDYEIQSADVNIGDIAAYDKQVNGFKARFTGSASSATVKFYVHGGNAS